jgi:hypothetical protein
MYLGGRSNQAEHHIKMLLALCDVLLRAKGDAGIEVVLEESFVVSANKLSCIKECRFYVLQILPSMLVRGEITMV